MRQPEQDKTDKPHAISLSSCPLVSLCHPLHALPCCLQMPGMPTMPGPGPGPGPGPMPPHMMGPQPRPPSSIQLQQQLPVVPPARAPGGAGGQGVRLPAEKRQEYEAYMQERLRAMNQLNQPSPQPLKTSLVSGVSVTVSVTVTVSVI